MAACPEIIDWFQVAAHGVYQNYQRTRSTMNKKTYYCEIVLSHPSSISFPSQSQQNVGKLILGNVVQHANTHNLLCAT